MTETHGRDSLSVDVEEYFHATIFERRIDVSEWEERAGRAAPCVERLLDLFDEWKVRATFFTLGWFAERNGGLLRRIAERGHELGSHSQMHRLVYDQSPDEFREDARRSKHAVEDASGALVTGYRAPTFSITSRSLWALRILAELGYEYDTSIFPIRHDRYGIPGFPAKPVLLDLGEHTLAEFPASTVRIAGNELPISGGGYIRLIPWRLFQWGLNRHRRAGRFMNLYTHPWEIDPAQPRVPLPPLAAWRHYTGLGQVESRLASTVRGRPFVPLGDQLPLVNAPRVVVRDGTWTLVSTDRQAAS